MVIYDLICDSLHEFEGWFKNPEDFTNQHSSGVLHCPICESIEVSKKATAPKLARKSNSSMAGQPKVNNVPAAVANLNTNGLEAYGRLQSMLSKVHTFIDANFEDVGNKFASEALSMHRGEKEESNIRGTASTEQLKRLAEEGVTALPMPAKPVNKKKLN
jgi:hypothetical protein